MSQGWDAQGVDWLDVKIPVESLEKSHLEWISFLEEHDMVWTAITHDRNKKHLWVVRRDLLHPEYLARDGPKKDTGVEPTPIP